MVIFIRVKSHELGIDICFIYCEIYTQKSSMFYNTLQIKGKYPNNEISKKLSIKSNGFKRNFLVYLQITTLQVLFIVMR